jgi:hypothetical protein
MWLDCRNVDAQTAAALLVPPPEGLFEAYEISTAVNRVANDTADLLKPAEGAEATGAAASAQTGAVAAPGPASDPARKPARRPKKDDRQQSLF